MKPLASEILESMVENERLLNQEDEEKASEQHQYWQPKSRFQELRSLFPTILAIVVCVFAFLFFIAMIAKLGIEKLYTHDNAILLDCGKSPAEAKARGCIFDIMNYVWTAPACYEPDLAAEALTYGPFPWFADKNATQPVLQDPDTLGFHETIWTTYDYHTTHCLYALKLVHRAANKAGKGAYLIEEIEEWNHTEHCYGVVKERFGEVGAINTRIDQNWDLCVKLKA